MKQLLESPSLDEKPPLIKLEPFIGPVSRPEISASPSPPPLKRVKLEDSPPRTPPRTSSKLGYDVELTPGNISQLGFDVALSPNPRTRKQPRDSLYTQAFVTALDTVLEHEAFLFSEEELGILTKYRSLPYEARYLYVRLFLRKRGAWFRVNKIGYEGDISNVDAACKALLCPLVGFAEDGSLIETLEDLLALLSLDELKTLAKDYNCKGTTKDKLLTSLLKVGQSQIGLSRSGSLGLDRDGAGNKPTRKSNQIMSRIRSMTGTMIRLDKKPVMLFHRLHLVFYRSSDYSEKSLTTLILARISKRNFPPYEVDRLSTIFASREVLLDYEHALKLKFEVDTIMELSSNQTEAGLDRVIAIFHQVYEDWQVLVMCAQDQETQIKCETTDDPLHDRRARYYARRFTAGWVWTRLLFKAAVVFAKRHEYSREHEVWTALLSQKVYRVGRRGEWYDRKALIEQHYNPLALGPTAEAGARKSKRLALETCVAGLQDVDTHQIYHHALQNRIVRLERDLNTVKRQQHDFSHILIRKPAKRQVIGVRLDDPEIGKHSVWRGKDGDEVSVEQLSLEFYETLGWRGFHSENSIVTTLFGLLFWDILFLPIPGVFQTAFQTAPLDLATDAFYPSRASALNLRLAAIENGKAADLLQATDSLHRDRETWCVGVSWHYALQDLLEIAACIGPRPLAQLCRLFAEEYGHRVGGIGDLCMWNPDTGKCLFVEVKGPGDRLSETQIAWLDQMALAGVDVELCLVSEVQPPNGEHTIRKHHVVKAKGKNARSSSKVISAKQLQDKGECRPTGSAQNNYYWQQVPMKCE